MSYYLLGCEVHTTKTYSKIAEAVDEETAEMLVDVLNASQQSVERTIEHEEDCAINVGMLGECDCGAE